MNDSTSGRRGRLPTTALVLSVLGLLGTAAVSLVAYRSSRELVLESLFEGNLALARGLAAHLDLAMPENPRAALRELDTVWGSLEHPSPAAFLCVVDSEGYMALDTGRPERAGLFVGENPLAPAKPGDPATVGDLLRRHADWAGINLNRDGEEQLVAYAFSDELEGLVVVHVDREHVEAEIRRKALPWILGLTAVGLLFVFALAVLAWSHRRQERDLVDALADLEASETRYRDLYHRAPDMFASVETATGRLMDCNETLARALGRPREELLGSHVSTIYTEASHDEVQRNLEIFRRTGVVRNLDLQLQPAAGPPIDIELNASAIRDEDGNVIASRSVLRDITALKEAEREKARLTEQLQHSQRLEALGTLAGGIAHDFNNNLLSIVGYTELVGADLEPGSPARAHLAEVLKATDRAQALVGNILTFSRKRMPTRVAVRLRKVVRDAGGFLRASISTRIGIDLDLGDADPHVLADANQLHQVIVNLGLNASQAIGSEHGTITITLDELEAEAGETLPRARIRVRDTGRGIEPDVLSRIFEPYFTTRDTDEGTGLGLAVVDGILQAHGGAISVTSEPGQGAEFTVLLPTIPKSDEAEADELPAERPRGGESILVLDDEPGLTRLAERRLGSLGYRVTCATEIDQARDALHAPGAHFDLLITDQNLHHATGIDFVSELRAMGEEITVLLATGTPDEIEPELVRSLRIARVLAKPYSLDRLAGVVREVLDTHVA